MKLAGFSSKSIAWRKQSYSYSSSSFSAMLLAKMPWVMAFWLLRALPSGVLGPVLLSELSRFASIIFGVTSRLGAGVAVADMTEPPFGEWENGAARGRDPAGARGVSRATQR